MIHLTVQIGVRPERLMDFLRLVTSHQRLSRAEPGCFQFDLCRQGRLEFLLYEVWRGHNALARHRATEHYARWSEAMPSIQFLPRVRTTCETFRTVFANGVFDGHELHAGHLKLLTEAAEQGDFLTVAINTDASVRRLKGAGRPVVGDAMRAARLRCLPFVGEVLLFDAESELVDLVRERRPDAIVKGAHYRDTVIPGAEFAGRVHLVDMLPGFSTTGILAVLAGRLPSVAVQG